MSHSFFNHFAPSTWILTGVSARPRPIEGRIAASRHADDISRHAVSAEAFSTETETMKRIWRSWLHFFACPEVDDSRASFTDVEETMMNLP
jgi:hypothetical protein